MGRPELIAVSAPLLVTTVWRLAATRRPHISARLLVAQGSLIEGDELRLSVSLEGSSAGGGMVEVALGAARRIWSTPAAGAQWWISGAALMRPEKPSSFSGRGAGGSNGWGL